MAESNNKRVLEYRIVGKDEASAVFDRVQKNVQKVVRTTRETYGLAPIRKTQRTSEEQDVRDVMARRIKAMRAAQRRARAEQLADERLFGKQVASAQQQGFEEGMRQQAVRRRAASVAMGRRGGGADAARRSQMGDTFSFVGRSLGLSGMGEAGQRISGGGIGAAAGGAIITEVGGRALARAAKASEDIANQFVRGEASAGQLVENMAEGLPLIGGWVQAGRSIRRTIDTIINAEKVRAEMRRDEIRQNKEIIAQKMQERAEIRRQHAEASDRRREGAEDVLAVAGRQGVERQRIQNQISLNRELEQIEREHQEAIAADTKNGGQLKSKLQEEAETRRRAARAKYAEADREVERQLSQRNAEAQEAHNARIIEIERNAMQTRLESQGLYRTARKKELDDLLQDERNAIAERLRLETEQLSDDDPRRAAAQRRAHEAIEAAEREHRRRLFELDHADRERREAVQREHDARIIDMRANLSAQMLRQAGKGAQAEQVELESRLMQSLRDIQQRAEEEIRTHGEDREAILRRASEEAQLAISRHAMDLDAMQRRRQAQYRPDMPGAISGDTRLLTGRTGLLGPLAEPTKQTAANTKAAAAHLATLNTKIDQLIAQLNTPPTMN